MRTPLTCETRYGAAAPSATAATWRVVHSVNIGEAVGVIAAQSIGDASRHPAHDAHLPHRWCGVAGGGRQQVEAKSNGIVRFTTTMRRHQQDGEPDRDHRSGEVIIADDNGRERERTRFRTAPRC